MLILPTLNSTFSLLEFERKDENRAFRDSVEFNISNLDKFPPEFEEFYNDNFSFRRPLLDAYHYFKFNYYHISPHPDKTIIGLNDWYYNAGKEVEIFEGKLHFSKMDLNKFKNEWGKRLEYFNSLDIKSYWLICPFKHHIYPEYLPLNVSQHNELKRLDQLKDYLDESFPGLIIDPTPELLAVKDSEILYYKLDNHWNMKAGYIASKLLLSKIQADFSNVQIPDIQSYQWQDSIIQGGIHYRVLGLEDNYDKQLYPIIENEKAVESIKYGFPPPKYFAYPWEYERRYINGVDSLGLTILVIRDSFGAQLIPFIKESFRESVFIFDAWQYDINETIIEAVNPDIVVYISLETHLESFIED